MIQKLTPFNLGAMIGEHNSDVHVNVVVYVNDCVLYSYTLSVKQSHYYCTVSLSIFM